MDIKEFKAAKREFEWELAVVIDKIVSGFKTRTGLSPEGISVYMVNVRAFGDNEDNHIVDSVKTTFDI